jgi:hypothetical protein
MHSCGSPAISGVRKSVLANFCVWSVAQKTNLPHFPTRVVAKKWDWTLPVSKLSRYSASCQKSYFKPKRYTRGFRIAVGRMNCAYSTR